MDPSHLPSINNHNPDESSSASSDDEDYVPKLGECGEAEEDRDTYNAQISAEELETIGVQPSAAAAAKDLGRGLKLRSRLVGDEATASQGNSTAGDSEEADQEEKAKKKREAEAFLEQLMAEEGLDFGEPSGSRRDKTKPSDSKPETSGGRRAELVEEVFDFAGEEVKVIRAFNDSRGSNLRKRTTTDLIDTHSNAEVILSTSGARAGGGGLQSAIAQLTKKKKLTVLEKSSLDWNAFVDEETGLEDELKRHAKSKDAYLQRREFLDKADYSRFEKERDLRQRGKKH